MAKLAINGDLTLIVKAVKGFLKKPKGTQKPPKTSGSEPQSNQGTCPSNGGTGGSAPLHIDIGGEGRYRDAINVNSSPVTSYEGTLGPAGTIIPNRVPGTGEAMPSIPNKSVGLITMESAPIRPGASAEIARVIKPGGEIRLVHPTDVALTIHHRVIQSFPGSIVTQTTVGTGDAAMTTTVIRVPGE